MKFKNLEAEKNFRWCPTNKLALLNLQLWLCPHYFNIVYSEELIIIQKMSWVVYFVGVTLHKANLLYPHPIPHPKMELWVNNQSTASVKSLMLPLRLLLTMKRSAGVAPEANLRNPFNAGKKACKEGIHPWLRNTGRRHQKSKTGVSVAPQKEILQKYWPHGRYTIFCLV